MYPKWIGPGVVTSRHSQHSYFVCFEDGKQTLAHMNKMWHYKRQVANIALTFHDDTEFGGIECTT